MNKDSGFRLVWETFGSFRSSAISLFFIILTAAVLETLGIGMILPLLETTLKPEAGNTFVSRALVHFPQDTHLLIVCLLTFFLICLKNSFVVLRNYYSSKFVNNLRSKWAAAIMENYLFSGFVSLMKHKQGVLINNMVHEPTYASKALRDLIDFLASCFIALGIIILLVVVNWRMTAVVGVVSMVAVLLVWRITYRYSANIGRRKIKLNQEISQVAAESIAGVRQVKIFSLERLVTREFSDRLKRLVEIIVNYKVVSTLPTVVSEVVVVIIVVGMLLFYRYGFNAEVASIIPVLGLFIFSAMRLFSSVSNLLSQRMAVASFIPSLQLVAQLTGKETEAKEQTNGTIVGSIQEGIRLQDVEYEFEEGGRLFNGLCLDIPKNQITAIVGPSGSGKSTICDLVTLLVRPTGGKILVDGSNLVGANVCAWRDRIGYVSQDTFLFNASVRENIAIGKMGADEKKILLAAELAGVGSFIENLPDSYDTVIGEGGIPLSGGQRQRVAIARALVRDPDLIIFDEVTSALDSESERGVLESLKSLAAGKTILFITHRLSSLWIADFIYVLDEGQVVESGTYQQLMSKKGNLWRLLQLSSGRELQEK